MQCTSFVPVYYHPHPRVLNGATGFSWRLMNGNINYGDQRCLNNSLPPPTLDPHLSYDKDVLRQIIQNHESTFRYQVQELHRLYQRQRELMEDTRMGGMVAQNLVSQPSESIHCPSYPHSDLSQTSHTPSWLLGDHKLPELTEYIQQSPTFPVQKFPEHASIANHGTLVRKNGCNEVKFLPLVCEGGKGILDLELPGDKGGKQFKEGNLSKAPETTCDAPKKHSDDEPTGDSEIGSVKTGYLCNYTPNGRKTDWLIDLNEPLELGSLSSNPIGHFEIRHNDPYGSGETTPESHVPKQSVLLNCSRGTNTSMNIDLNSVPDNCFPETETTPQNNTSINEEIIAVQDCISVNDCGTRKEKDNRGSSSTETRINDKLKLQGCIDLNLSTVAGENSPLQSSITISAAMNQKNEISSTEGKFGEIQQETSILSERGDEKSPSGPAIIAAETLVVISSGNSLFWFAEVASSMGDDLENEIMRLQNNETDSYRGKEKETNALSSRSTKSTKKASKGFLELGAQKRNARRKACAKPRKCSKSDPSDVVKKSMSSILMEPATCSKQGVLQGWGKIGKRQGGHRHKASKFLAIY